MRIIPHLLVLSALALALAGGVKSANAQGTVFSYQGRLNDNGSAANGNYDVQFYLRDAATDGNPVGPTNTLALLQVSNGLFTASLNFGGEFDGNPRYLEIGVRTNGSMAAYATLSPRQLLTPVPYAMFANTASNLNGTLSAGQLSGTVGNSQLANSTITANKEPTQ